jgi:HK97 family phage prohead protease
MGTKLDLARPDGPEYRYIITGATVERRADDSIGFKGYAAKFNKRTQIGPKTWGFQEQIAEGAFAKSIGESDVRFLQNHDPNFVLARSKAGTLRLAEDKIGLPVDADMAPTSYARDLAILLDRGEVDQMSFAFTVVSDKDERWETLDDGTELRTILRAQLWDVSAVTFPAYKDTTAGLRSVAFDVLADKLGLTTRKRSLLVAAVMEGADDLDEEVRMVLRTAQRNIASLLKEPPQAAATDAPEQAETPAQAAATRGVDPQVWMRHQRNKARALGLDVTPIRKDAA